MNDWQSITAAAIVLATLAIVLRRVLRKKPRAKGCGGNCCR
ncbi:FeoB-associated Cys-rich membrane protein [Haloferula sargassicola]|uniref:FeoB-associated Cys-rich membrane protein n=1 Tax=Haloferula sargassicola TaxID=490096 RepID=A0ABP9URD5_9BACT